MTRKQATQKALKILLYSPEESFEVKDVQKFSAWIKGVEDNIVIALLEAYERGKLEALRSRVCVPTDEECESAYYSWSSTQNEIELANCPSDVMRWMRSWFRDQLKLQAVSVDVLPSEEMIAAKMKEAQGYYSRELHYQWYLDNLRIEGEEK